MDQHVEAAFHPILVAALRGNRAAFKTALSHDWRLILHCTPDGLTPLECAALANRPDMVLYILSRPQYKVLPDEVKYNISNRAMKWAVTNQSPCAWACLEWWLQRKAPPPQQVSEQVMNSPAQRQYLIYLRKSPSPLFAALTDPRDGYDRLQWILWTGYCDVEALNGEGLTPFAKAVKDKRWEAARLLYEAGADITKGGAVDRLFGYRYTAPSFLALRHALEEALIDRRRLGVLGCLRAAVSAETGGDLAGFLQTRVAAGVPRSQVVASAPTWMRQSNTDRAVCTLVGLGRRSIPEEIFQKVTSYMIMPKRSQPRASSGPDFYMMDWEGLVTGQ